MKKSVLSFYNRHIMSVIMLLVFILNSCASLIPDSKRTYEKSKRYSFEKPTNSWDILDKDQSDFAIIHSSSGSIITGNSICKKYTTTSLSDLANNIFTGVTELQIISKNTLKMFNRDTLIIYALGKIDGVTISIKSYTLKKDRCIYDFILIYPGAKLPETISNDMTRFMKQVRVE